MRADSSRAAPPPIPPVWLGRLVVLLAVLFLAGCFVFRNAADPPAEDGDASSDGDATPDLPLDSPVDADALDADLIVDLCLEVEACSADAPLCGPSGCQAGDEGDPCVGEERQCRLGYSCVDEQCWDGSLGDPCRSFNDCLDDLLCGPDVRCRAGATGEPCSSDSHCQVLCSSFDDTCQDGLLGSPCNPGRGDCVDLPCGPDFECQLDSRESPCTVDAHCGDTYSRCGPTGLCQTGGPGDPCESSLDCAPPNRCNDDNLCD